MRDRINWRHGDFDDVFGVAKSFDILGPPGGDPKANRERARMDKRRERAKGRFKRYESIVEIHGGSAWRVTELRSFRHYEVSEVIGGGFVTNRGRDELDYKTYDIYDADLARHIADQITKSLADAR